MAIPGKDRLEQDLRDSSSLGTIHAWNGKWVKTFVSLFSVPQGRFPHFLVGFGGICPVFRPKTPKLPGFCRALARLRRPPKKRKSSQFCPNFTSLPQSSKPFLVRSTLEPPRTPRRKYECRCGGGFRPKTSILGGGSSQFSSKTGQKRGQKKIRRASRAEKVPNFFGVSSAGLLTLWGFPKFQTTWAPLFWLRALGI